MPSGVHVLLMLDGSYFRLLFVELFGDNTLISMGISLQFVSLLCVHYLSQPVLSNFIILFAPILFNLLFSYGIQSKVGNQGQNPDFVVGSSLEMSTIGLVSVLEIPAGNSD